MSNVIKFEGQLCYSFANKTGFPTTGDEGYFYYDQDKGDLYVYKNGYKPVINIAGFVPAHWVSNGGVTVDINHVEDEGGQTNAAGFVVKIKNPTSSRAIMFSLRTDISQTESKTFWQIASVVEVDPSQPSIMENPMGVILKCVNGKIYYVKQNDYINITDESRMEVLRLQELIALSRPNRPVIMSPVEGQLNVIQKAEYVDNTTEIPVVVPAKDIFFYVSYSHPMGLELKDFRVKILGQVDSMDTWQSNASFWEDYPYTEFTDVDMPHFAVRCEALNDGGGGDVPAPPLPE